MNFLIAYSFWNIYKGLCFGMHFIVHLKYAVLWDPQDLTHAVAEGKHSFWWDCSFQWLPYPTPPPPQRIKSQCLQFRNSFDLFPAPLPFLPIWPCKNLWDSCFCWGDPSHPSRPDSNMTSFRRPFRMLPGGIQNTSLRAGPVCSSAVECLTSMCKAVGPIPNIF